MNSLDPPRKPMTRLKRQLTSRSCRTALLIVFVLKMSLSYHTMSMSIDVRISDVYSTWIMSHECSRFSLESSTRKGLQSVWIACWCPNGHRQAHCQYGLVSSMCHAAVEICWVFPGCCKFSNPRRASVCIYVAWHLVIAYMHSSSTECIECNVMELFAFATTSWGPLSHRAPLLHGIRGPLPAFVAVKMWPFAGGLC